MNWEQPKKSITASDGKRVKIYFVKNNDGAGVYLNYKMLKNQKCTSDQIKNIIYLAKQKRKLYDDMQLARLFQDVKWLKELAKKVTQLEYKLQENWNFKKNKKYHRFWEMPGCACPKLDNMEAWPTGHYIISGNCVIHGGKIK